MRYVILLISLILLAALHTFAAGLTDNQGQARALERAKYYEVNAGFSTIAFRELESIIESASGNYDGLLACVEAVYSTGSNTPIIIALALSISKHENEVAHFDRLLEVARFHTMNSRSVQQHIEDFVDGTIGFSAFQSLVATSM